MTRPKDEDSPLEHDPLRELHERQAAERASLTRIAARGGASPSTMGELLATQAKERAAYEAVVRDLASSTPEDPRDCFLIEWVFTGPRLPHPFSSREDALAAARLLLHTPSLVHHEYTRTDGLRVWALYARDVEPAGYVPTADDCELMPHIVRVGDWEPLNPSREGPLHAGPNRRFFSPSASWRR